MDLLKFIEGELKWKDVSIYAPSDYIVDFLYENEIIVNGDRQEEILNENDYVILSRINIRNNVIWILEELFDEDGETTYNESDVAIIFEDLVEIIDLDNVIVDEIVIAETENEDEQELYFEDLVEDFLSEFEEGDCLRCALKSLIDDVYHTARKDLLFEILEEIE